MKIGVFDSGIGGKAVAMRLGQLIPDAEIMYVNDHEHVPYGSRHANEIIYLTDAAIQPLLAANCDAIIIACNTATSTAIEHLRAAYPAMHFVGLEPMVKPAAAHTHTGTIAVLATPATLASESYKVLKQTWAKGITVVEPDTSSWAGLIENERSDEINLESMVTKLMTEKVDVIVLACTHYHWLRQRAEIAANGQALILEPSDAIGNRVIELLRN